MRFNFAYKQRVEEYSEDGRRAHMEIAKWKFEEITDERLEDYRKRLGEDHIGSLLGMYIKHEISFRCNLCGFCLSNEGYNYGGIGEVCFSCGVTLTMRGLVERTSKAESELAHLRTQLATAQEECDLQAGIIAADTAHVESLQAELAALRETNARLSAPVMSDEEIEAINRREGSSAADFAISFMERNNPPAPATEETGGTK
jgi:hypothetical protein